MAKTSKVKPTYMTGKKPLTIGLHDIFRAFQAIDESKSTAKFIAAAKEKKAFVSVDADTVNFVKDFFANNDLHDHPVGRHIVNARVEPAAAPSVMGGPQTAAAPPSKDFDCDFGRH